MSDLATPEAPTATDAKAGTGKFFWYELMTSDLDAAIDYYTKVVGWTASDMPMPGDSSQRYVILNAGDRGIGGVMQITDQMRAGGARPGWLGYIHVADADAAAKSIAEAGGKVLMGPQDIPEVGRFALAADPGGAPFYVMMPFPREAMPPLDPATPGAVSWHELYSSLGDKVAFDFYAGQFGWETLAEMDMGPMGSYRIFGLDGVQMGGMMKKPDNVPVSAWGYYVNVDGLDAAVERINANGGKVVMGPMEVPGGSWVCQAVDPQGAHFALISPKR
ncbi:MAG TPA: VOC family protein [Allosphingosinicella sp.]|nr:VOC family protein [Allosphingosinicella sp.]